MLLRHHVRPCLVFINWLEEQILLKAIFQFRKVPRERLLKLHVGCDPLGRVKEA